VRVGVDGRSLVGGGARGVAHYTSALLGALAAAHPVDEYRLLLPRGPVEGVPAGVEPVRHPLPGRVVFGAAAIARRPTLDGLLGGCDVLWAPAPAPLAPGRCPLVLSVHDRGWELRPGDFTPYERAWHAAARPRALARGAARVLCATAAGRRDLVEAWGVVPDRVRVVPLAPFPPEDGGTAGSSATVAAPALEHGAYFLFVGALEPRKAPDVLAAAFAAARAGGLAADLVVVGAGRLAGTVAGAGVYVAGRVSRAELTALYRGALALVLPSHVEGFGLPAVEALAQGTPVIASDLAVLREVLGSAGARFVPPGDARALAGALLALAGDAALRARLTAAGSDGTASLDWAASARAARAALAEAAGCRS
jgi:glycosyltransferase involved in cell wall biosynthesis